MIDRLSAHRGWANRRYLEWLAAHAAADAYCVKMLSHVIRSEAAWLTRLRGGTPEPVIWIPLPPAELEPLRAANEAGWSAALAGDLARRLAYRRFDGTETESSVEEVVMHVCTHGMYHRGQIAAHAARAGFPRVPSTDFIVFARLHS